MSVSILAGTAFYYQNKAKKKDLKVSTMNLKTRAAYLSFLLHDKGDELQNLLIDIVQSNIIKMGEKREARQVILEICPGWKDNLFRKTMLENENENTKKAFRYIDNICEKK